DLGERVGLEGDDLGLVDLENRSARRPRQPVGPGIEPGGQDDGLAGAGGGRGAEEIVEEPGPHRHLLAPLLQGHWRVVVERDLAVQHPGEEGFPTARTNGSANRSSSRGSGSREASARAAATIVAVAPTLEARSQLSPSVRAESVDDIRFPLPGSSRRVGQFDPICMAGPGRHPQLHHRYRRVRSAYAAVTMRPPRAVDSRPRKARRQEVNHVMAPTLRPRRSALYLPGNKPRALEKGKSLPADVLIFDLEDAVGPDAKAESRATVCDAISSESYRPREVVVRINGLDTDWHNDDLAAVAASAADGVLVPKVETGQQVQALADALDTLRASDSLQLWVMIETPRAFLRAEEVASASDRLAGLVVGTNDLVNELHGLHVPGRAPVV